MLVNITVTAFNRIDCTVRTILALHKTSGLKFCLNVIDNNSSDETPYVLADLKKKNLIHNYVRFNKNMGPSCSTNYGWDLQPADYYIRMDNDIVIQRKGWLLDFITLMQKYPDLSLLSFPIFNKEKDYSPVTLNGFDRILFKSESHPGGLFCITDSVFKTLGYWNEEYGSFGVEDGDYTLRIDLSDMIRAYFPDFSWGEHIGHGDGNIDGYGKYKKERQSAHTGPQGLFMVNELLYSVGLKELYINKRYDTHIENGIVFHTTDSERDLEVEKWHKAARMFIGNDKTEHTTKLEAKNRITSYYRNM